MGMNSDCHERLKKFERNKEATLFSSLMKEEKRFIKEWALEFSTTLQELRQLVDITIDLRMWRTSSTEEQWKNYLETNPIKNVRNTKKNFLNVLKSHWENQKIAEAKDYTKHSHALPPHLKDRNIVIERIDSGDKIYGDCPVASDKTICCNLKTIDLAQRCTYGCNYCIIQTFYHDNKILIEDNIAEKIRNISIDPTKNYHFGTGQSADSLMLGNHGNILDEVVDFASKHSNIILELKTKSNNIDHLLKMEVPSNVLCSWTLNTGTIINHEEHLTAKLEERIDAAKKLTQKGILVGFHLHPIIPYKNWEKEYEELSKRIMTEFIPKQIAFVSFGTLTFIKPVIKEIRKLGPPSKVLQMPLVDANGRYSYPEEIKKEIFSHIYQCFKPWHNQVYFYFCMEPRTFWESTFSFCYDNNEQFEADWFNNVKEKSRN